MRLLRLVIPICAGLLMAFGTVVAFAGGRAAPATPPPLNASETGLLPAGLALNIHADSAGRLWITEIASNTVREFDPATQAYTLYTGVSTTVDAQLGPDGKLWWLDATARGLASMDLGNLLVTTWPLTFSGAHALTFDASGRVWVSSVPLIGGPYRFDPSSNTLCDLDLPDGGAGPGIAEHDGALWLADEINDRIGRITPTTNAFTYWNLAGLGPFSSATSFAFDPNGNVWWADSALNMVGRLAPNTDQATLFGPPGMDQPQQVVYHQGKIWFTSPFTGSLGYIDPAVAGGSVPQFVTPTTTTLVPSCATVTPGVTFPAAMSTGLAAFSPVAFTTTVNTEGTLLQVPAGGMPWGLASVGFDVFATDPGRNKLIRIDTAAAHLYLPLVRH